MSRWDGIFSSAVLSLAKEISKSRRVFYIDYPFTFKEVFQKWNTPELKERKQALVGNSPYVFNPFDNLPNFYAVTPLLNFPMNFFPPGPVYAFAHQINNGLVGITLVKLFKEYHITKYVFLNSFNPFYGEILDASLPKPLVRVYQSRDDISQEQYVAKHGVELEKREILRSDVSLATSAYLAQKLSHVGKSVQVLANAVDFEFVNSFLTKTIERPTDLPTGKPIAIYIGNYQSRVDLNVLVETMRLTPEVNFVLIGPKSESTTKLFDTNGLSNVFELGSKRWEDLPKYLKYADIGIIPFEFSELTKSIYPLKINEYLALGLPVVTTNFSLDIGSFQNIVSIIESNDSALFSKAIKREIESDTIELRTARVQVAKQNSWASRKDQFWEYIFAVKSI